MLALYGRLDSPERSLDYSKWWSEQDRLVEARGLHLTHVFGDFLQKPRGLVEHRAYSIERYGKRILRQIESHNVNRLGLESLLTKPKGAIAFDWDYFGDFGEDSSCPVISLTGFDLTVMEVSRRSIETLIDSVVRRDSTGFLIQYGMSTIMPRNFLPAGFSIGLGCTAAPEFLRYDANAWSQFAGREHQHRLRNVFGYNILNRHHLELPVGDSTLAEWIAATPDAGRIVDLSDQLVAWTFADDQDDSPEFLKWDFPPVEKVRRALESYSLFPWQEIADD